MLRNDVGNTERVEQASEAASCFEDPRDRLRKACSEAAPLVTADMLRDWLRLLNESCAAPDFRGVDDVRWAIRGLLESTEIAPNNEVKS